MNDLKKAIVGQLVMTQDLEKMYEQLMNGQVPDQWQNVSYLSLKPLNNWISDLSVRLDFWKDWIEQQYLESYLISAFFFPQGFITAIKQIYSRQMKIPIDTVIIQSDIRSKFYSPMILQIGACVHGIYLQGCKISTENYLDESLKNELNAEIPFIILTPTQSTNKQSEIYYKCPFYMSAQRKGELNTSGHSSNFIIELNVKTKIDPDVWIRRGVAIVCQTEI